jgi:2-methylcitrate synthase
MATKTETVDKGLDNIIVEETSIGYVDGKRGKLLYRGYDIEDLTPHSTFEEAAYLIWNGELPKKPQLTELTQRLKMDRALPKHIPTILRELPNNTDPMDALKIGVAALGPFDPELADNSPEANMRKAIRLTAKIPTLIAAANNIREGKEPLEPHSDLDHAANFLYMLTSNKPDELTAKIFDEALILHLEHGANASTFSCIVTASTLADLYSAVVSGIGTLKGPLHGGANENALNFFLQVGTPDNAATAVNKALDDKIRIPGFGHRVYRAYDPRARIFKDRVRELSEKLGNPQLFNIAQNVEEATTKRLTKERNLFPNIDFYSGIVYHLMGIPTDLFTPVFAMSRVVGWTAHILEYVKDNRLVRPRDRYIGALDKKYTSIGER